MPPGFFKVLCFFQRTEVHHPGGEDTILGMYFVSLLTKNHIGNLLSETTNYTGSLPFDIFHRPKKCVESDHNIYYSDSKDRYHGENAKISYPVQYIQTRRRRVLTTILVELMYSSKQLKRRANFSQAELGPPSSSRLTTAAWRHRVLARLGAWIARFKILPCLAGITRWKRCIQRARCRQWRLVLGVRRRSPGIQTPREPRKEWRYKGVQMWV